MQRYGQKTSKIPQKWGFSPICDPPRFFFKNRALSLLYPYGALTSCKKLEKTNEQSLRYLKTDGHTDGRTDGQGRLLRTPSGKPGVQNVVVTNQDNFQSTYATGVIDTCIYINFGMRILKMHLFLRLNQPFHVFFTLKELKREFLQKTSFWLKILKNLWVNG